MVNHIVQSKDKPDIFEPFDRCIRITIGGEVHFVPENNSILRCLQYLNMESIAEADLCWNGDCLDCQVWIDNGGKEKAAMACRTVVRDGMRIVRMCPELEERMSER